MSVALDPDAEVAARADLYGDREAPIITVHEPLPVPHRLAIIYLALPLAVWLIGYFHWWFGLPLAALLGLSLCKYMAGSWRFTLPTSFFIILAISVLYIALSPVTFSALGNTDQPKHRAILTDLVESDWPARTVVDESLESPANPHVRYYLGYYIIPALLAKPFGLAALHVTVPLWTLLGYVIGGMVLCHGLRNSRVVILMVGSGAFAFLNFNEVISFVGPFLETLDLNWKDNIGLRDSNAAWRSLTWGQEISLSFRFAPQHFLAFLIGTSLLIRLQDSTQFHRYVGVMLVCVAWWSPYMAVAIAVLVVGILVTRGPSDFLSWQNLLAAPALAFPVALFVLAEGPVSAQTRWIWELVPLPKSAFLLGVYYLAGFIPWAVIVYAVCEGARKSALFWASCLGFLLSPLFSVEAHYLHGNELHRNVILVFMLVFWFWVGQAIPQHFYDAVKTLSVRKGILVLVILIMLLPGMQSRAIQDVWAIADSGLQGYYVDASPVGQLEFGDMYLVERWPASLKAVLKD